MCTPLYSGSIYNRVALMECISVGAKPKALTAAICNEPDPTGKEILVGISNELKNLFPKLPVTISTEKNMPTCQTGLGITIVGLVEKRNYV